MLLDNNTYAKQVLLYLTYDDIVDGGKCVRTH